MTFEVFVGLLDSLVVDEVQSFELVGLEQDGDGPLQKLDPPVQVYHIHHILNHLLHLLPLLCQLPLRFEAKVFAYSENSLLDKGKEAKRRGVFVFKVLAGDEKLDKSLSVKDNEKEEAQERVKDSSNVGQYIKDGQVSNMIDILFFRSCKIEGKSSSCNWLVILSFDKGIKLEPFGFDFFVLKGHNTAILVKGVFDELEVDAFHERGVFVAEVADGGGPELCVVVGVQQR